MKQFTLEPAYICDVTIREGGSIYAGKKDLTPEEMIKVLKGEGQWTSIRSEDHPEFTAMRDRLENEGYITTVRQWSNGDYALKPFKLNDRVFKKGDQFPCAAAQSSSLKYDKKYGLNKHTNLSDNSSSDNPISDLGNI